MPTEAKELAQIVATAEEATGQLADKELQKAAFERVLEHLLKNGDPVSSPESVGVGQATTNVAVPADDQADATYADEQQRIDAIARYFQIEPEDVQHICDTSEYQPKLDIYSSHLANQKAEATRQIALLVTGMLTALGIQATTASIRSVAKNYNKLDPSNFMKTLGEMSEISVLGKHNSPNRVVRMKVPGAEKSRVLVQKLISG